MTRVLFAVLLCLLPALSQAQETQTHTSEQTQKAVALWLNGDDLPALRALADLARSGDVQAQILLARIGSLSYLHKHVTGEMPRKERIALLREPGGLSGKSWLAEAARNSPLAAAFLDVTKKDNRADAIPRLLDLGESNAAMLAANVLVTAFEPEAFFKAVEGWPDAWPEEFLPVMRRALELNALVENGMRFTSRRSLPVEIMRRTEKRLGFDLVWHGLDPLQLSENPDYILRTGRFLAELRPYRPLVLLCERMCPETPVKCAAVIASMAKLSTGPLPFSSPAQSLIPDEAYWSSPRIDGDIARRLPDLRRFGFRDLHEIDACAIPAMIALQETHGFAEL